MAGETTQRGYPLPNPDNVAREDATRIRNAIAQISDDLTAIEERNVVASETAFGSVRLASAAEATAGTASDRVATVKRTKDMITSALTAISTAMITLQEAVNGRIANNEAEVDQAVADLNSSVATQLQSFTATLATKLDKAGGALSGPLDIDRAAGSVLGISGKVGGKFRWQFAMGDGVAESGSNAGSNLQLNRFNDAGEIVGTAIGISRASGNISLNGAVALTGTFGLTVGGGASFGGDTVVSARLGVGGAVPGSLNPGDLNVMRPGSPTTGAVFFGNSGSRYIFFDGSTYQLGGLGTIWTSGNIGYPVTSLRAVYAGDLDAGSLPFGSGVDNYGTMCVVSGIFTSNSSGNTRYRFRYHQFATPQGWYNFS
ncbi:MULTISPECIES: hypothetical protein [unclassified Bradyrhizobium]|uniref:hypothetical protein n=1 Tax=unclassified Bradyrhizobium TaxID=2631580 RepID=UPI0029161D99|nr:MULTISPECIES: hypothetical protein [unclassified Bradyrhizobium]